MNGKVHHFRPLGLVNGLVVLTDKESRSQWDHITGESIAGLLKGHQLDVWPMQMTTVRAALAEYPELTISFSQYRSLYKWLAGWLYPKFIHQKVLLPYFFNWTMYGEPDPRLPKLTQGLGVIVGKKAKYYPMTAIPLEGLQENWSGRILQMERGKIDGAPRAIWQDTGEQPMQLLTRWYGFSFTYPSCEIYGSG